MVFQEIKKPIIDTVRVNLLTKEILTKCYLNMLNSKKYKIVKKCRLCSSNNLVNFIDFTSIALGNNLLNTKKEAEAEEYPRSIKMQKL